MKWTKEKIIKVTKPLFEERDMTRIQFTKILKEKKLCTGITIKNKFGSLDNFTKEAGVKFISSYPWTKEKIIEVTKLLFKERDMTRTQFVKMLKEKKFCSCNLIRKRFGNINNFTKEAGASFIETPQSKKNNNPWTKKDMIKKIKPLFEEKNMTRYQFVKTLKEKKLCCYNLIKKIFGSLDNFAKEVGIKFIETPSSRKYNNPWTTKETIKTLQKITEEEGIKTKSEIYKLSKEKKLCSGSTIKKLFGSLDELANQAGIKIKKRKGTAGIGNNEKQILDIIEKEKNIKLERQHNVGYRKIDGYDPINNIAYEVDEPCHKNRQIEDFIRQKKIEDKLGCKFVRIDEREFLKNVISPQQTLESLKWL